MYGLAGRYISTLRHMHPWQVVGRILAPIRRRTTAATLPTPPAGLVGRSNPRIPFPLHDPWNSREHVLEGRFCFLHQAAQLGRPVRWSAEEMPLLWRFHLHSFRYLHLLDPVEQVVLCREWTEAHPKAADDVAWHPFPTSLRITNWCKAGLKEPALSESLYRQAAFLSRNMETYVRGNHILENARALILAGAFFEGEGESAQWLKRGLRTFRRQTREQILEDGGHYERSPMYHALMLEAYVDVLNVLPAGHADREYLLNTVRRMADFLVSVTHPDGRMALFNDSAHDVALPTAALSSYVNRLIGDAPNAHGAFPKTGYFRHSNEDIFLLIDGGPIGPDDVPGHAHADIFSYELSIGARQFVVDTGVYEYEAGVMRDYVRGTRAHNTVTVDGINQADVWSSFRVGRRFSPSHVRFDEDLSGCRFEGRFSGYADLIGDRIDHERRIITRRSARDVTVEDRVTGTGTHVVESRIHFHPQVSVKPGSYAHTLTRGAISCRLTAEGGPIAWEEGWYCPEFGLKQRTNVASIRGAFNLPVEIKYRFEY